MFNERQVKDAVHRAFQNIIASHGGHPIARSALEWVEAEVLNSLHVQGIKVNTQREDNNEEG